MARRILLAAVFAVLLAGCGDGSGGGDNTSAAPAEREQVRATAWQSVTVDQVGLTLTIDFTGGPPRDLETDPCASEYEAESIETVDTVTVTIWELKLVDPPDVPDDWTCTSEGYGRTLIVVLDAPLGNRSVIDGRSGQVRHAIDPAELMIPAELPEGWSEWYRRPDGSAMVFGYGPDGGDGFAPIEYTVAPVDGGFFNLAHWSTPDLTTVEELELRGGYGVLVTSLEDGACHVVFEEDDRFHRVTTPYCPDPGPAIDFAEGLAPG